MKSNLFLAVFLCCLPVSAAEPPINELLRDALYSEEVTRDADAAAKQYEEVVSRYASQRQFAATAIFRLAEVRRKQGRKDEAIGLYQRLVAEFPESEAQVGLAKENLAAMGGKLPDLPKAESDDYETEKIAEIGRMMKTSPDVATGPQNFSFAINQGSVRVMAYLLEKGGDPNTLLNGDTTPLPAAVSHGHLAICELLIKAGAKLNPDTRYTPLVTAVDQGHIKIAELLLKSGADVNFTPPSFQDVGTPLEVAIDKNNPAMIDRLLAAKADPNLSRDPRKYNFTPLHHAVGMRKLDLIRALMDAGADPNIRTYADFTQDNQVSVKEGDTALDMAAASGSPEILKLLLPKADASKLPDLLSRAVSASSVATAKLLLDAKADPNQIDSNGKLPLIILAASRGNPEMVKLLLASGANPGTTFRDGSRQKSALRIAVESRGDNVMAIIQLLLDAGAKPDEAWLDEFTGELAHQGSQTPSPARTYIVEKFVIPRLTQRPAVTLLFTVGATGAHQIVTGPKGTPDTLPQLLLGSGNPIPWPLANRNDERFPETAAIWRKAADGKDGEATRIWSGTLRQKEDFPALEWGDVIQLGFSSQSRDLTPFSFTDKFPAAVEWNLRRQISFPIKIQIGGKSIDYQVRGDRLVFDATKREIPWLNAGRMAPFFAEAGESIEDAVVSREGWPDVQLDQRTIYKFPLKARDSIRFIGKFQGEADPMKRRKAQVILRAAGLPALRTYPVLINDEQTPAPTLTEALADILSLQQTPDKGSSPADMMEKLNQSFLVGTVWIQPDFSRILIRRLKPDDTEETIPVDFARTIAGTTGSESVEVIRKLDVPLKAGDLVEIPLKGDPDDTWKGLTAKEEAFFAKVLNCRFQCTDESGDFNLRELRFKAQEYTSTEAGKLPLNDSPGEDTVPSFRALNVLFPERTISQLVRDGKTFNGGAAAQIFLHEGDRVATARIPAPPGSRVIKPRPAPSR